MRIKACRLSAHLLNFARLSEKIKSFKQLAFVIGDRSMNSLWLHTFLPLVFLVTAFALIVKVLTEPNRPAIHRILALLIAAFDLCGLLLVVFYPHAVYGIILSFTICVGAISVRFATKHRLPESDISDSSEPPTNSEFQELKQRIQMLTIFNSLKDSILVLASNGQIIFMNQVAIDRFGDQVGLSCLDVLKCTADDCAVCPMRTQRELSREYQHHVLGREYEMYIAPIHNDLDNRYVLIARDVTEQKMLQFQLIQNEKMSSLGQLVAGIAHEVNNPITFISTNLEMLRLSAPRLKELAKRVKAAEAEGSQSETIAREVIDWIYKSGLLPILDDMENICTDMEEGTSRVTKLVKDLKDFSHQGTESANEADLNEIIRLSLRVANNQLKHVSIIEDLSPNLPTIIGYPQQLKQVFLNFFINSAHAMAGRPDPTLRIETQFADGRFTVIVTDNGSGIPENIQNRIFDPFFTTKDVGEGTGLGMSVAFSIIRKHGGDIRLESTPDIGTRFTILLDHVAPDEAKEIISQAKQKAFEESIAEESSLVS